MSEALIRKGKVGEEAAIHEAHMRSIREVCVKDHGEEEIRGWGNRPLGDRWTAALKDQQVWVIDYESKICGVGYLNINQLEHSAYLHALYLTPEVLGMGLGHKLACQLIEDAKKAGVRAIFLDSTITAYEFYKKLGFTDSGPKGQTMIGGSHVTSYPMVLRLS